METNKKKILEISCRSDIGGGPVQLFKIMTGLKDDFNFYCACPDQQPYFAKITNEGFPVFELPCRKFTLLSFLGLLKWTKENNITIVHSHGRGAGIFSRLLKIFNKDLKIIHTYHGVHFNSFNLVAVIEWVLKYVTDKFVFVSKSEQQLALKYKFTEVPKCVLIENGTQINKIKFSENEKIEALKFFNIKVPQKSFVIGMLSRFDKIKNIPYAIRSLADFLKSEEDTYLIIGGDGEYRHIIENTIAGLNLQSKVLLPGFIHDIQKFLRLADVFLSTSIAEAFGLSTIEAMKYGKPVIVSKVCGNVDVVDDGETGLLFSLEMPSLLVDKIKVLKNDKETYDRLVKNARVSVENRFDLKRMTNQIKELYLSL